MNERICDVRWEGPFPWEKGQIGTAPIFLHAIVETGLDDKRFAAKGPTFAEAWKTASHLNESLAAWMELHYARQHDKLRELVWAYIRAGSYPQWPYRGAERIEALYQWRGIEGVRELIGRLRNDPESVQAGFDTDN